MKISLCSVVYNEAHRIQQFIENALPHVDEIVIVDQQSTDGTLDVVKGIDTNGVPVVTVSDIHWGFCEPSRRLAHAHATGDWILALDADERVSDRCASLLQAIRSNHPSGSKSLGYRLKRSLWLSGVHYWTGDYQYRLFHRDAVFYLDELHTEPQPKVGDDNIGYPDWVAIWHEKSWQEQIRDEQAYAELINQNEENAEAKLSLNVYTNMLKESGLTPEQADDLLQKRADDLGALTPEYEAPEDAKWR